MFSGTRFPRACGPRGAHKHGAEPHILGNDRLPHGAERHHVRPLGAGVEHAIVLILGSSTNTILAELLLVTITLVIFSQLGG